MEIKRILYDLHKENKEDISKLREDVHKLRISVERIVTRHGVYSTILGALGGAIIGVGVFFIKLFFS